MTITEITKRAGAHKRRIRVGRGESSGHGKTCGRGTKGAGARAGYRPGKLGEGAMFPLFRRLPKFGFSNVLFTTRYQVVNLGDLQDRFDDGAQVTPAALKELGLIHSADQKVKVLGDGELKKKLTVSAHRFSGSAVTRIEAAGGTVKWLDPKPKKKFVKRAPAKPVAESPAQAPEGEPEKPAKKKPKTEGKGGE